LRDLWEACPKRKGRRARDNPRGETFSLRGKRRVHPKGNTRGKTLTNTGVLTGGGPFRGARGKDNGRSTFLSTPAREDFRCQRNEPFEKGEIVHQIYYCH